MYFVDILDGMLTSFMGPKTVDNDLGTTDNRPRNLGLGGGLGQILQFMQTLYNLTR